MFMSDEAKPMEITLKQLRGLLKTLQDGSVSEFEYEDEKYRLRLSFGKAGAVRAAEEVVVPAADARGSRDAALPDRPLEDPSLVYVTSPFVGTFYRSSTPESEPFAAVGSAVKQGQTLCIVEAMKLMNEIEAEFACTIVDVLVENGASVEFGQKLFKVKKS